MLATVAQLILLPLAAVLMSRGMRLDSALTGAVLVLALCPGGAISNYYVYLARGDVALSIALTAVSTLLAVVTVPTLAYFVLGTGIAGAVAADWEILSLSLRVLVLVFLPSKKTLPFRFERDVNGTTAHLRVVQNSLGNVVV